jgi:DNA-binding MurR/RpiR family transcriptional regulator
MQIKVLYEEMGKAEKKIADWILLHPGELIPLSISELADKCGCSEATIVRFARRLGFGGYQELKISLAREESKPAVSATISREDSCSAIFGKVCNEIYYSLELTKKALQPQAIASAAQALLAADSVLILGLGNSAPIAMDAEHKLLRTGIRARACSDNHMQAIAVSHTTSRDAVIGISHSGSSKDIVEALKIARQQGAATICITNHGKSPIVKQSDIVLQTASNETQYSILALNSRIAQLAIIDTLYFYLVYQREEESLASIEATERALQSKKF